MSADRKLLDDATLRSLAEWRQLEEVHPGDFAKRLKLRLTERLRSQEIDVKHLEHSDSGLSSYDLFFATPAERRYGNIEGVAVYVSCFIRVAAVGVMKGYFDSHGCSYVGLNPEDLRTSSDAAGPLLQACIDVVREEGYDLLTREEALFPLPAGVVPHEYCLGDEPWDRVFHVLFSNAD